MTQDGAPIAYCCDDYSDTPSPDARLIAAAPDLLAALKHITSNCRVFCEDSMDIDDGAVYDARAAISKAEGITQNQQP